MHALPHTSSPGRSNIQHLDEGFVAKQASRSLGGSSTPSGGSPPSWGGLRGKIRILNENDSLAIARGVWDANAGKGVRKGSPSVDKLLELAGAMKGHVRSWCETLGKSANVAQAFTFG